MKCLLFLCLAAASQAGVVNFAPSTAVFPNPERGFYGFRPLTLASLNGLSAEGHRLCYFNILLNEFRTQPLNAAKLLEIRSQLGHVRAAGVKAVLRVSYNAGIGADDAALGIVQQHLAALKPVFEENDDIIAFYQAGIIGAWGEWHSSTMLTTPADRVGVFQALLANVPAHRFIQLRTPSFMQELTGLFTTPLTAETAFQPTTAARTAHHNDCWLASITDMGTYPLDVALRLQQKAFLENHTRYTPWGGETCELAPPFSDGTNALAEAARFHASYLNIDFRQEVIAAWQADGTLAEFQKKLGYRFQLNSATLPDALVAGSAFNYAVQLQNIGWAACSNSRPVFLRVLAGTQPLVDLPLAGVDPRRWLPESGIVSLAGTLLSPVTVPSHTLGFALWMPDAAASLRARPEYSVRFANDSVWDAAAGHNVLVAGQLTSANTVNIDGNFQDWPPVATTDPANDHAGAETDYASVSLADDAHFLYVRLQFHQPANWTARFRSNLFIDVDNKATTGFATHGIGSEILIQGGQAYHQTVGNFNAGQISGFTLQAQPLGLTQDVELRIPRKIGSLSLFPASPSITVVLDSQDTTFTTMERLPNSGGLTYAWSPAPTKLHADALSSQFVPAQGLSMLWKGDATAFYRITASSQLAGPWQDLGVGLTNATGELPFIDLTSSDAQRRFYRVSHLRGTP